MKRNGGRMVVDSLIEEGVDTVFTVPGESFLPVLDAMYDSADQDCLNPPRGRCRLCCRSLGDGDWPCRRGDGDPRSWSH